MPVGLRRMLLMGIVIFPASVAAETLGQSLLVDRGPAQVPPWISSWVAERFPGAAPSDPSPAGSEPALPLALAFRQSTGPADDPAEHLEAREIDRIKAMVREKAEAMPEVSPLKDENYQLMQQLEATQIVLAVLDARARRTNREKEMIVVKAKESSARIAALEGELEAAREEADESTRANEQLRAASATLRRSVADLEEKRRTLEGDNDRLSRAASSAAADEEPSELRSGWIAQLLGYHRGYADAAGKVEISAGDERENGTLTSRLRTAIGPDVEVPDLTPFGMTLVGGQIPRINGAPAGRILYRDAEGRTLEIWLSRQRGRNSQVNFGQNGALNIVHWIRNDTEYGLIGAIDWDRLAPIAGALHQGGG